MHERPNILWLVAEDICPDLGCYGHPDSVTPNVDSLASEGVRFTHASSVAPVCSPARSCLITGVYPSTMGSEHLRSEVRRPEHVRCFTEHLRDAGYYCFNGFSTNETQSGWLSDEGYQSKFDYNFDAPRMEDPLPAWDAVSGCYPADRPAHWRDRADGQPFFGQIGFFITHSSQYGTRHTPGAELVLPFARVQQTELRDPDTVALPVYHPPTDGSRRLWAEYHECVTEMDYMVGEILAELEKDGLAEETIVFFFGDNGMGVLGGKCWLWEQGLHVPLVVRCPERYRHLIPAEPGAVDERMVSFEDFAPTVLRLAGLTPPEHMQGRAFLGDPEAMTRDRRYVYGIRGRIDHCDELIRSVRTRRHQYLRNFMPHIGWDYSAYYWQHAPQAFADWQTLAASGDLEGRQRVFFRRSKPIEELYDLDADPYQMHNLADDPGHASLLEELREECESWMIRTRDLGLLTEYDLHRRSEGRTPYEMGSDAGAYPIREILRAARLANERSPDTLAELRELTRHDDAAVRRWAAVGIACLGGHAEHALAELRGLLADPAPDVRIVAAETLTRLGYHDEGLAVLQQELHHDSGLVAFEALWALERLGPAATQLVEATLRRLRPEPREPWLDLESGRCIEPHVRVMVDIVLSQLDGTTSDGSLFFDDVDFKAMRRKFFD